MGKLGEEKRWMVFQTFALLRRRPVLQKAGMPRLVRGEDEASAETNGRTWLARVGLDGYEDHYPHQLSGGMQQRVGIARALAAASDIISLGAGLYEMLAGRPFRSGSTLDPGRGPPLTPAAVPGLNSPVPPHHEPVRAHCPGPPPDQRPPAPAWTRETGPRSTRATRFAERPPTLHTAPGGWSRPSVRPRIQATRR